MFGTLIFINKNEILKKKDSFTFFDNLNQYIVLKLLFFIKNKYKLLYVVLSGVLLEKRARIASAATNGVISPRVTRSS